MNKYDYDYFIAKFSAIPEELWTTGKFFEPQTGRRCALGHCGISAQTRLEAMTTVFVGDERGTILPSWPEARALQEILNAQVGDINNGWHYGYQQPTPRARILAALHDAKAKAEAALDEYERRPLIPSPKQPTSGVVV